MQVGHILLANGTAIITILLSYVLAPFLLSSRSKTQVLRFRSDRVSGLVRTNDRNPLLNLPVETLLYISDRLDLEFQVLFALSCKRLFYLLAFNRNLRIHNLSARIRFLQRLEVDHPEYLTCCQCGWMYLWRRYRYTSYGCPRTSHSPIMASGPFVCKNHHVLARRGVVDLIFRGPQNGLPISWLNSNGLYERDIMRTTEARWVEGQVLLASEWTWVFHDILRLMLTDKPMLSPICWHRWHDWKYQTWHTVKNMADARSSETLMQKCARCDTDFQVFVENPSDDQFTVCIKVWQRLGSRENETQGTKAFFDPRAVELDVQAVQSRNLKSVFDSGETTIAGRAVTCQPHL